MTAAAPKTADNKDAAFSAFYQFYKEGPSKTDREIHITLNYRSSAEIAMKVAGTAKTEFPKMHRGECRLFLVNGSHEDIAHLEELGSALSNVNIQATGIEVIRARMSGGGLMEDCYQSTGFSGVFNSPNVQARLVARRPTHTRNIPSVSMVFTGYDMFASHASPSRGGSKANLPAIVEVSDQTFHDSYALKEGQTLIAKRCTFEDDIEIKTGAELENCAMTLESSSLYCRKGSIKGKDSTLQELNAGIDGKGDIELIDSSAGTAEANNGSISWINSVEMHGKKVDAGKDVTLEKVAVESFVRSKTGSVYAKDCSLHKIMALGSVSLTNSTSTLTILTTPLNGICEVQLPNSTIKANLKIVEGPIPKEHIVCGYPASFNYPNSAVKGVPPEGARGRIAGELHEYVNRQYQKVPLRVVIKGGTITGDIVFVKCEGEVDLQEGATVLGTIIQNSLT